jgi:hypothetical protein
MVYKRVSKGMTEKAQDGALLAAGLTEAEIADAYIDGPAKPRRDEPPQPQRDYMIGAARDGDEVWVARAGVLATTETDAIRFVSTLCEMGAVLRIANTGETFKLPPDASKEVADALRLAVAIRDDERKAVLEKARSKIRVRPGRVPVPHDKIEKARVLWADDSYSVARVSKLTGLAVRTLYRYLGPKGTPAFGKKP